MNNSTFMEEAVYMFNGPPNNVRKIQNCVQFISKVSDKDIAKHKNCKQ